MVAEEVFVNCYNFNPIWVQHASSTQVQKVIFKESSKIIRSRSRNTDLRLRGSKAGAERNIFSAPQHREYR
jgi:hypothetical protein